MVGRMKLQCCTYQSGATLWLIRYFGLPPRPHATEKANDRGGIIASQSRAGMNENDFYESDSLQHCPLLEESDDLCLDMRRDRERRPTSGDTRHVGLQSLRHGSLQARGEVRVLERRDEHFGDVRRGGGGGRYARVAPVVQGVSRKLRKREEGDSPSDELEEE